MEGVYAGGGPVRRPLLGVAVAFVLGTALHTFHPIAHGAGFALSLLALGVAFAVTLRQEPTSNGTFPLWRFFRCSLLLAAVVVTAWSAAGLAPSDSLHVAGIANGELADGRRVSVTGVIAGDPETPVMARGEVWTFPLRVETVTDGDKTYGGGGLLRVRWKGLPGAVAPGFGERWSIEGRMCATASRNPEWRTVLRGWHAGSRRLSGGHGNRVKEWCYEARRRSAAVLSAGIEDRPETAGVLRALMLGYRSDLDPDLHALFVSTGTLHIFAISGSHIVILAGLVLVALRALRVPRMWWSAAIVPLLAGFTLATGAEASAVRACIMASVYWVAPLFGRRPDALSSLAFSALLILGVDPGQLSEAGFVFSFAVVLGLIVLNPLLDRRLRPLWEVDPLRIQPERPALVALRTVGRHFAGIVSLTLVAWVVSTPITACWFGRFTFSALPANLVIVPLTALAMLSGCLSLLLGHVWIGLAEIFNNASLGVLEAMLWVLRGLQRMPAGNVEVAPWSGWMVAAWYAVLAGWAWIEQAKQDGQVPAGSGTMADKSHTQAEVP